MPYVFNPLPIRFDKTSSVAAGGGITQLTTDDGVVTPSGGNVNLLADDTSVANSNGITVDGNVANTATILLTNRLQGTGTSTNSSNADAVTFDLGSSAAVYRFDFQIAGRSTAGAAAGEGVTYFLTGAARTDGATATVIGSAFQDVDEDTALNGSTATLVASGNDIILRLVGIAGETITYNAVGTYVVV